MSRFVIVYLTMSGNTKKIAEAIAEGAKSHEVKTAVVSFQDATPKLLHNAEAIAIGSPTYLHTMHAGMKKFLEGVGTLEGKIGVAFGSYGWSGEAPLHIAEKMRGLGVNIVDPVLRIQYAPDEKEIEACRLLGSDVAVKIKKLRKKQCPSFPL